MTLTSVILYIPRFISQSIPALTLLPGQPIEAPTIQAASAMLIIQIPFKTMRYIVNGTKTTRPQK
jgi:hypothetical protein